MIRVGFVILCTDSRWLGGLHYFKNLLKAVLDLPDREIEPVIIAGQHIEQNFLDDLPGIEVVRSYLLDRHHICWMIRKGYLWMFGHDFFLGRFLLQHKIHVLSHSGLPGMRNGIPTIGWIPDFQHLHLPEMFSTREIEKRDAHYMALARQSERVILSSQDTLDDFKRFAPNYVHKARVLSFVARIEPGIDVKTIPEREGLEKRYDFEGPFFYLPNQIWKHKNHRVVLDAVSILKKSGREVLVLCSGHEGDYRNRGHLKVLKNSLQDCQISYNVRFLGVVNRVDMFGLMRHCISVINPSLFEGWSTTVEEAKSLGKHVILSDIVVHHEQDPPDALYFDPRDAEALSDILWLRWGTDGGAWNIEREEAARRLYETRRTDYAQQYQRIVMELGILRSPPFSG